jgi:hypothetical protein
MRRGTIPMAAAISIAVGWLTAASAADGKLMPVTIDSFRRAESDTYFAQFVNDKT